MCTRIPAAESIATVDLFRSGKVTSLFNAHIIVHAEEERVAEFFTLSSATFLIVYVVSGTISTPGAVGHRVSHIVGVIAHLLMIASAIATPLIPQVA